MRHPYCLGLMMLVAALPMGLSTGCATVVNGTTQVVHIQSSPLGARVQVNGEVVGSAPVAVKLDRDETHHVRIGLPGFRTFDMLLQRTTSGWAWGNLLLGSAGLIGFVVDAISGALYKLTPRQLQASALLGGQMTFQRGTRDIHVWVTLYPESGWQRIGTLNACR